MGFMQNNRTHLMKTPIPTELTNLALLIVWHLFGEDDVSNVAECN